MIFEIPRCFAFVIISLIIVSLRFKLYINNELYFNYSCIYQSTESCEFEPRSWRGVLDTTLCDKVCQWLATGRWFSPGTPVSSTNKTDRHDMAKVLLTVASNTTSHHKTESILKYWHHNLSVSRDNVRFMSFNLIWYIRVWIHFLLEYVAFIVEEFVLTEMKNELNFMRREKISIFPLWTFHLYVATLQQHMHMKYISFRWSDIPELVVYIRISVIEGCC
jgi:hypothetical protein